MPFRLPPERYFYRLSDFAQMVICSLPRNLTFLNDFVDSHAFNNMSWHKKFRCPNICCCNLYVRGNCEFFAFFFIAFATFVAPCTCAGIARVVFRSWGRFLSLQLVRARELRGHCCNLYVRGNCEVIDLQFPIDRIAVATCTCAGIARRARRGNDEAKKKNRKKV